MLSGERHPGTASTTALARWITWDAPTLPFCLMLVIIQCWVYSSFRLERKGLPTGYAAQHATPVTSYVVVINSNIHWSSNRRREPSINTVNTQGDTGAQEDKSTRTKHRCVRLCQHRLYKPKGLKNPSASTQRKINDVRVKKKKIAPYQNWSFYWLPSQDRSCGKA